MKDGEMTSKGMVLTLANGTQTVVKIGDKVKLVNGITGIVRSWARVRVMVALDNPFRIPANCIGFDLPAIAALHCGTREIIEILPQSPE